MAKEYVINFNEKGVETLRKMADDTENYITDLENAPKELQDMWDVYAGAIGHDAPEIQGLLDEIEAITKENRETIYDMSDKIRDLARMMEDMLLKMP